MHVFAAIAAQETRLCEGRRRRLACAGFYREPRYPCGLERSRETLETLRCARGFDETTNSSDCKRLRAPCTRQVAASGRTARLEGLRETTVVHSES